MTHAIEVDHVSLRFGEKLALDDVSFTLDGGGIYGLLGRNGSGKSTLLSVIAAFRQPTSGSVRVGGQPAWENASVVREICLVRESGDLGDTSEPVSEALDFVREMRPAWDEAYANRLLERFEVPRKAKLRDLSRGKLSALGIVIGLAGRAPVTMFDESYLGLDASSRYLFYDELLADFMANPRIFVISTHLIEEVSNLFGEVLILDRGKLLLREETDVLRSRGAAITGPAEAVDRFADGLRVLSSRELGRTKSVTVFGTLDRQRLQAAEDAGLEVGPVALQDLFVHLTEATGGDA